MNRDEVKSAIRRCLEVQPGCDQMDIAEKLDLDLEVVCSVMDEMERDGLIVRDPLALAAGAFGFLHDEPDLYGDAT